MTGLRHLTGAFSVIANRKAQHPYLGYFPTSPELPQDWPFLADAYGNALMRAYDADRWASLEPPADSPENCERLNRNPLVAIGCRVQEVTNPTDDWVASIVEGRDGVRQQEAFRKLRGQAIEKKCELWEIRWDAAANLEPRHGLAPTDWDKRYLALSEGCPSSNLIGGDLEWCWPDTDFLPPPKHRYSCVIWWNPLKVDAGGWGPFPLADTPPPNG